VIRAKVVSDWLSAKASLDDTAYVFGSVIQRLADDIGVEPTIELLQKAVFKLRADGTLV
jgi:hypothetical protein